MSLQIKSFLLVVVTYFLSMTSASAQGQLPTIDEALAMSKRSGAPILAMAGQDY